MNKKGLKLITQRWYAILEAQGFNDIEKRNGQLKDTIESQLKNNRFHTRESGAEYFDIIQSQIKHARTKRHKEILELHASGQSFREVARNIGISEKSVNYIHRVIKAYARKR